jgi:NADP-dependent 3-hydroxy acid dehydrogenase YdfG
MKTAIITGASSGIGEATAIALSKEGFNVVLTARSFEKLQTLNLAKKDSKTKDFQKIRISTNHP